MNKPYVGGESMLLELTKNVEKMVIGKADIVEKIVIALLCKGHVLLEDVPGVGKTTLVRAIAQSLDLTFSRIQFTPDLLPADLLGVSIFNPKDGQFYFQKGPLHNQLILADEINRTSPKTQSSLLEVMQEQQITVDNKTYKIQDPFMVIATQNPIEHEGTFPLPESQLDRFFMKLSLGYPSEVEEFELLDYSNNIQELSKVIDAQMVIDAREEVKKVHVADPIKRYIIRLCRGTRKNEFIELGASPRATLALYDAVKAMAYLKNKSYVSPEDVKNLFIDILSHRIFIAPQAKYQGKTEKIILKEILDSTAVPLEG